MKIKTRIKIGLVLVIIGIVVYLGYINFILDPVVNEPALQEPNVSDLEVGDCWLLEGGKKICYLGTANVTPGVVDELTSKIMDSRGSLS